MKKTLLLMGLVISFTSLFAQNTLLSNDFKKQYEGRWLADTKYQMNTLEIKFEAGKNYATVIDIGSGEAPAITLHAFRKNKMLIIQPATHHNDYCELEVKNGKLIFRTQPTVWEANGKAKPPGKHFAITVFKKGKTDVL